MAAKSRAKVVEPVALPSDWEAVVREALLATPGVKMTELKKALPKSHQKLAAQALATAQELAARGVVVVYGKGKTQYFFPTDPLKRLDEVLLTALARQPQEAGDLKQLAGPHGVALDDWLKQAVADKKAYVVPVFEAGKKTKKKAYSTKPDARESLAPVLKALVAALKKTAAQGISNEQVARVLLDELGLGTSFAAASTNGPSQSSGDGGPRGQFLGALQLLSQERPREALLPVRDLRARLSLAKAQFDELALQLMRDGAVSLHHTDHPAAMTDAERAQLVEDARGTFYIGIAARSGA